MSFKVKGLTAAQVILLAADDLCGLGVSEFTEWDLTVAAWNRDKQRFGLRGYEAEYPDHKRMYMEIAGHKSHNPLVLGFMEKVRPNIYRVTPRGRVEASRLRDGKRPVKPQSLPACEPDYNWLGFMRDQFADSHEARVALPSLWAYLCRNPKANRYEWEWVGSEWVSTAKG